MADSGSPLWKGWHLSVIVERGPIARLTVHRNAEQDNAILLRDFLLGKIFDQVDVSLILVLADICNQSRQVDDCQISHIFSP